ncbi:MAG: nitroreductase/quinone reductase family protein, partial [Gammaproteobacteria bacterium]|nr:nitroreductase/quinone reductase family protein [Gammaproteobacteria bacterium]
MTLMGLLTSKQGLEFDKYLVRYCGHSLLNQVFARRAGFEVQPALLLRTQGRKTGVWRDVVLPYFPHEDALVVVGSRGGARRDPQWVHNLRARPQAEIFVGCRLRLISARLAEADEYAQLWRRVTLAVPTYAEYQRRCEAT